MNNKRIIPTSIPDVDAKIRINTAKGYVSGYLIDHKTRTPLDSPERSRKRRQFSHSAQIQSKIRALITALEEDYRTAHKEEEEEVSPKGIFSQAFGSLPDPEVLIADMGSSAGKALRYFSKNVIPLLDKYGSTIQPEDMEAIKAELFAKTNSHGNSYQDENTERNFEARLQTQNAILLNLQAECPQLPQVSFLRVTTTIKRGKEQIKSIPEEFRVQIASILLREAATVDAALAAALMHCGGLRTGEAAAVQFGQIKVHGRFAILFVEFRIYDNGCRNRLLKTDQAYRLVVLPYFFVALYQRRRAHLHRQGYSDTAIDQMPIIDLQGANAGRLSAYGKDLILRSGFTQTHLDSMRQLMKREPDIVDGKTERDITAYIFRRDWCTRMTAYCDMHYADVDYYIGHRNRDVEYSYYLNLEKCAETARILERYVFTPEFSFNPVYCGGSVTEYQAVEFDPSIGCRIRNDSDKPMVVEIELASLEPGTETRYCLPRKPIRCQTVCKEDLASDRWKRPILGSIYSADHFKRQE